MLTGRATSADHPKASPELIHGSGGLLHSMKSQGVLVDLQLEFGMGSLIRSELLSSFSWSWCQNCVKPHRFLHDIHGHKYLLPAWVLINLRDVLDLGQIHFCRVWFSLKFFCNQIRAPLPVHTCGSPAERLSVLHSIKLVLAFHSVH